MHGGGGGGVPTLGGTSNLSLWVWVLNIYPLSLSLSHLDPGDLLISTLPHYHSSDLSNKESFKTCIAALQ